VLPIQQFASNVLAEIIRRQPASKERTAFAWQLAVGPALARVTTVELADGILTIRAVDPRWIAEIRRAREEIAARLQHLLGRDEVTAIRMP
jgi:predicted nucleic acid-binding Zn ribbon protein